MILTIPKEHRRALITFFSLPASAMETLADALREARPTTSSFEFAANLLESEKKLPISFPKLLKIVRMLTSLYRVWLAEEDRSLDDFVEDVIETAEREIPNTGKKIDWTRASKALRSIFSMSSLGVTSKAFELLAENERRLCPSNCRVLTDIRPVFLRHVTEGPDGAIIQHTLKIAYHDAGGEVREFYVALESDEIRHLQSLLDRAIEKEQTLRSALGGTEIPLIGQETDQNESAKQ